jgi:lipid-A-disaccharide synthase
MDKLIVKELIQTDFNSKNVSKELEGLLKDGEYRNEMLKNMDDLAETLGGQGASDKAATLMINYLKS